jgi:hypothetical protein
VVLPSQAALSASAKASASLAEALRAKAEGLRYISIDDGGSLRRDG